MKKIALSLLLMGFVALSFGQSLKKVNNYLEDKKIEQAKAEIDAYLVKKPEDTEGLYLKSKIYAAIADSAALHSLVSGDARVIAFDAFKIAHADSGNMKTKLLIMKDNLQPVFSIYSGYYSDAADAFNKAAQAKDKAIFEESMNLFMKADKVGHYLAENKLATIGLVDSVLVLNIGKAALNAGKEDIAKEYFLKIADAKINGTNGVIDENFRVPYQWLTLHFKEANDEANMLKYAALGKEAFPEDDYYDLVIMENYRDKKEMAKLFDRYQELVSKNPDSLSYHFNYANEIFGYLYNSDEGVVVENKEKLLETLHSELDKAISLKPEDVNTNWLYAQYHYNKGIETRDKALKDAANKAALLAEAKTHFQAAIPYAEKAITNLEATKLSKDRSRYKSIVNLMQNIYQSIEDKTTLKVYQDKYDKADAVFVN